MGQKFNLDTLLWKCWVSSPTWWLTNVANYNFNTAFSLAWLKGRRVVKDGEDISLWGVDLILRYVSVFVLCYLWHSTYSLTPTVLCEYIHIYHTLYVMIEYNNNNNRAYPPLSIGIGHGIYGYIDRALYGLKKMCYVKNNVAQKH